MAVQGEDCDRPTAVVSHKNIHVLVHQCQILWDTPQEIPVCVYAKEEVKYPLHMQKVQLTETIKVNTIHVAVSVLNFCFVALKVSIGSCVWCSAMTIFSIWLQSKWSAGIVMLRLLPLMKGLDLYFQFKRYGTAVFLHLHMGSGRL